MRPGSRDPGDKRKKSIVVTLSVIEYFLKNLRALGTSRGRQRNTILWTKKRKCYVYLK